MARIVVDLARRIGTVDRRIFGNFISSFCLFATMAS